MTSEVYDKCSVARVVSRSPHCLNYMLPNGDAGTVVVFRNFANLKPLVESDGSCVEEITYVSCTMWLTIPATRLFQHNPNSLLWVVVCSMGELLLEYKTPNHLSLSNLSLSTLDILLQVLFSVLCFDAYSL